MIVEDFQFVPPGVPQPALLRDACLTTNGHLQLTVVGEPDWPYRMQSSTNLVDWLDWPQS